jgi:hypothetical protein
MNDITSKEWFQLEMERDALDTERQKWAYERDKKLRPETEELDEKLERLDPERLASYQKLERQIWKIMTVVHEGMLDSGYGRFAAEKVTVKKRQLYELGNENLTMDVRPCKWRRRHWLSERMWHCTEEEANCVERIRLLNQNMISN